MKTVTANIMGGGIAALCIENGVITDICKGSDIPPGEALDFGDALLVPGFVDIHVHGGGGYDFVDMTKECFDSIRALHLSHGTTTLCPTLTSCSMSDTFGFLDYYRAFEDKTCFAGVHLEGPFLSPEMCGAQNLSYLINPDAEITKRLSEYSDILAKVTLAPEKDGCDNLISELCKKGVVISAGHSNASAAELRRAIALGARQVTHMYCATPKRYKEGSYVYGGFEETALTEDALALELIADGHHVCRECFEMAVRCKGIDNVIAVSDAMRGAGQDGADFSFLGRALPENRVIIEDGVAKLPDRSSFAGSVTLGDRMFDTLTRKYGYSVADASKMLSESPAKHIGLERVGRIEKGFVADFAIIKDGKAVATIKNGKQI